MKRWIRLHALLLALLFSIYPSVSGGQGWPLPVRIEHSVRPQDAQRGETITDQLNFRALHDLQHMDVTFRVLAGVQLLSDSEAVFADVKANERRQVDLRVTLIADRGRVAVTCRTREGGRDSSATTVITFGQAR